MSSSVLLDVSRLVSRAGRGVFTGVDRVEWAYLQHVLERDGPAHFLTRELTGLSLLDRAGMAALTEQIAGRAPWGPRDAVSRLGLRQSRILQTAESAMRRHRIGWSVRERLPALLRQHLAPGFAYLNVGHSNQSTTILEKVGAGGAGCRAVMVHDVIPLDFPEFARPDGAAIFAEKLRGVARGADALIYNSADTARRATARLAGWNLARPSVTAPLGLDPLPPLGPPADGPPYFVVLGTIEPRKNHLLLLNVWRRFHDTLPQAEIPHLHIVGRRGWENENILDQLERAPFMGSSVFERGTLDDAALSDLLAGARALLFPSFAEGFGYPLVEALAAGVPAIAADLPVFREIAGALPLYRDPLDGPAWAEAILAAATAPPRRIEGFQPPRWDSHFAALHGFLEGLAKSCQ